MSAVNNVFDEFREFFLLNTNDSNVGDMRLLHEALNTWQKRSLARVMRTTKSLSGCVVCWQAGGLRQSELELVQKPEGDQEIDSLFLTTSQRKYLI